MNRRCSGYGDGMTILPGRPYADAQDTAARPNTASAASSVGADGDGRAARRRLDDGWHHDVAVMSEHFPRVDRATIEHVVRQTHQHLSALAAQVSRPWIIPAE